MNARDNTVRVWVNVTTSATWNRPAVGIVRVERALAEHLQSQLGPDRCRLCVWREDRFVEWTPELVTPTPEMERALNVLLPRSPAFDLARSHVARALQGLLAKPEPGSRTMRFSISLDETEPAYPLPGDILVSAGLDWDHPYAGKFHALAKKQGLRIVSCCYDLIPVLFPQFCVGDVARHFTEYFMALNWGSEAVMCISEQSQRDYLALCDDMGAPRRRTIVIPLGDNLPSGGGEVGEQVRTIGRTPFILFVSTIERRKNHEVLYRAYHLLARRGLGASLPALVFVGMQGWGVGDLMKDIELDPQTSGKITQLHHVSDAELAYLYETSLFCVFPSLYEGWGLPVGEALSMGKAVIASSEGSLPEVGGDLVRYVPPWNAYAWADALYDYIGNPQAVRDAEQRVRAGYRPRKWADTAARVVSLVEEMTADPAVPAATREFFPGYECGTECGIRWGSSIRTLGREGILMYGPYLSLRSGAYRLQVRGSALEGHAGAVLMEVTSNKAGMTHVTRRCEPDAAGKGVLADFVFELPRHAQDVEFRCRVEAGCAIVLDEVQLGPARGRG